MSLVTGCWATLWERIMVLWEEGQHCTVRFAMNVAASWKGHLSQWIWGDTTKHTAGVVLIAVQDGKARRGDTHVSEPRPSGWCAGGTIGVIGVTLYVCAWCLLMSMRNRLG